jgi:hypothetical protein
MQLSNFVELQNPKVLQLARLKIALAMLHYLIGLPHGLPAA